MTLNNGGPAFPVLADVRPDIDKEWCGMTLRDYFAAKAMQGIISNPQMDASDAGKVPKTAYALADGMLEARK